MRLTPEQKLVLRLCATSPLRPGELETLVTQARSSALLELLRRLNLGTLIGARLKARGIRLSPEADDWLEKALQLAGGRGRVHELILLAVGGELSRAGIRNLPLKGSALAIAVHGDPALRVSDDLDLLVDPEELPGAVVIAGRMGWESVERRSDELPLLHVALVHPELPRLELHWRLHWYEKRFAADALRRAVASDAGVPLRMAPADELAALVLFHARDGLSGLRLPADISAWATSGRLTDEVPSRLVEIAGRYPELARLLAAGVTQLDGLVGLPVAAPAPVGPRERAAIRLSNPFLIGERPQIRADASFADMLLAPPGGVMASARRQFDMLPRRAGSPMPSGSGKSAHVVRTVSRWCASATRAIGAPRPRLSPERAHG